ncbi:hypothetical protein NARC_30275 [Candidatus Nitrosocosmicus arcticus]|uniref:Uncharacterized protein n=2 Tax=Candidatus Nitrosocosmicus arcticus TaxID=2035267 RepID=A0A557SY76_9ARCH|nr:hypothetical protein NARC_30275 [Candidatus Nitrosocosmicus arcticus]
MRWVLAVYALILFGLLSIYSLSASDIVFYVNSTAFYNDNEKSGPPYPDEANIIEDSTGKTLVEIVKSFKNSSGFYKINGTLENQGAIILSDIKVMKYYKIPSVNDTTLICYEDNVVSCEYKSTNQLPQKSFFLAIPDANIHPR